MEFGLFMMPIHPPHRSYADSYERDLDLIVRADKLGFKEVWVGEHAVSYTHLTLPTICSV